MAISLQVGCRCSPAQYQTQLFKDTSPISKLTSMVHHMQSMVAFDANKFLPPLSAPNKEYATMNPSTAMTNASSNSALGKELPAQTLAYQKPTSGALFDPNSLLPAYTPNAYNWSTPSSNWSPWPSMSSTDATSLLRYGNYGAAAAATAAATSLLTPPTSEPSPLPYAYPLGKRFGSLVQIPPRLNAGSFAVKRCAEKRNAVNGSFSFQHCANLITISVAHR